MLNKEALPTEKRFARPHPVKRVHFSGVKNFGEYNEVFNCKKQLRYSLLYFFPPTLFWKSGNLLQNC